MLPPLKHQKKVIGAVFNNDNSHILTWDEDGTVEVWNSNTRRILFPALKSKKIVRGDFFHAEFNGDGSRILTWINNERKVQIFDGSSGDELFPSLYDHEQIVGAVFNDDNSHILTWDEEGVLRIWNSNTRKLLSLISGHKWQINKAVFSGKGEDIISWGSDGVRIWENSTVVPSPPMVIHNDRVLGADVDDDESRILTWGEGQKGALQIWDMNTGTPLTPVLWQENAVNKAVFSGDANSI